MRRSKRTVATIKNGKIKPQVSFFNKNPLVENPGISSSTDANAASAIKMAYANTNWNMPKHVYTLFRLATTYFFP